MTGALRRRLGFDLRGSVLAAARDIGVPEPHLSNTVVAPGEVAELPEVVQRYLDFMGVVDRPRAWSVGARFQGRFRLGGRSWLPADAWQYNCVEPLTRLFHMRLQMARVIPLVGHDTYVAGDGQMIGRLLGVIPVVRGHGDEFDVSELTTYLNDALVLAPSMLLTEAVTWEPLAADRFGVTLTHAGHTVRAEVDLDERGAMRDFSTEDRWADLPGGLVRARWTTPFDDWLTVGDRPLPSRAQAIWHLEEGPFPYVEGGFVPESVEVNVSP